MARSVPWAPAALPPRRFFVLAASFGAAMLAAALAFQYLGGLEPCALCLYQRLPYAAVVAIGVAGALFCARLPRSAVFGLGGDVGWVARVDIETQPPIPPETLREQADALGDLARLLAEAPEDVALLHDLEADVGLLAQRLKPDVTDSAEDAALQKAISGDFAGLAEDAVPWLLARLAVEEA